MAGVGGALSAAPLAQSKTHPDTSVEDDDDLFIPAVRVTEASLLRNKRPKRKPVDISLPLTLHHLHPVFTVTCTHVMSCCCTSLLTTSTVYMLLSLLHPLSYT